MGIARGSIDYRFPSPLSIHSTTSQVPTMRPFSAVTATAVAAFAAVSLTVVNASPLAAVGHLHEGVHRAPLHVPNNPWAPEGDAKDDGLVGTQSVESNLIPDQYIVVLKEDMGHALPFHLDHLRDFLAQGTLNHHKRSLVSDVVENIAHHFDVGAMKGYAGRFSQQTLEWIRKNPAVAFVEQDSIVRAMVIERGAPWGLARISHRKPLSLSLTPASTSSTSSSRAAPSGARLCQLTMSTPTEMDTAPTSLVPSHLPSTVSPRMPTLSLSRFWDPLAQAPCPMSSVASHGLLSRPPRRCSLRRPRAVPTRDLSLTCLSVAASRPPSTSQ